MKVASDWGFNSTYQWIYKGSFED